MAIKNILKILLFSSYSLVDETSMVNPANDIAKQARQGSVAAIIQVLNDKLADRGVRTRAVFSEGVLQLLCEASTQEQLEQTTLVERVKQILEAISPRNIRRVNINSRLVREQQLLWLEEINRDPERQLLWSQEIVLSKPNFLKRFTEDLKDQRSEHAKAILPKSLTSRPIREQRQFWRGMLGGAGLSIMALLAVFGLWYFFGPKVGNTDLRANTPTSPQPSGNPSLPPSPVQSSPAAGSPVPVTPSPSVPQPAPSTTPVPTKANDAFVEAVRLAEQASRDGKTAATLTDWLNLAAKWQRASDLMGQIPAQDARYATARSRIELYRRNSEAALQEAQKRRSQATTGEEG